MAGGRKRDDSPELLWALRNLRDAGMDPTVLAVEPNPPPDTNQTDRNRSA